MRKSFPLCKLTSEPFYSLLSLLMLVSLLSVPRLSLAQTIRYVSTTGTNPDPVTATSWGSSTTNLQGAVNASLAGDQVWVAGGTYKPTSTTARDISFVMKEGVAIYGGFAGNESSRDARLAVNPVMGQPSSTTLSGDIGLVGDNTDNSFVIIFNNRNNLTSSALLDGFVITGSSSNGGFYNIETSPSLTNLLITGNAASDGGGVFNALSSPIMINCSFSGNMATNRGGGIFNTLSSSPSLTNCVFSGNTALNQGGGVYNTANSSPSLINCLLTNNTATNQGGAFHNYSTSNPRLINCTLTGNSAGGQGGAVSEDGTNSQLTNCILWNNGGSKSFRFLNGGNITLTYCLIESTVGGYSSGPGNLTVNRSPFASATSFQLRAGSPAINAGSTAAYQNATGPATDLGGLPRILGGSIDMGAYELPTDLTVIVYVRPSVVYNTSTLSVVVDVAEVAGVPTSGPITVRLTKSSKLSLSLPASATSVGNRTVQNSRWQLTDSNSSHYVLTTSEGVGGLSRLSFGLTGVLVPGATTGNLTLSAVIEGGSGGELRTNNNTDAEKLDYFQQ